MGQILHGSARTTEAVRCQKRFFEIRPLAGLMTGFYSHILPAAKMDARIQLSPRKSVVNSKQ